MSLKTFWCTLISPTKNSSLANFPNVRASQNRNSRSKVKTTIPTKTPPPLATKQNQPTPHSQFHLQVPQDRYIAPEMQSYTRIYRFGHDLLIPTSIGKVPNKLFLMDTGAMFNFISPAAGTGSHQSPRRC
jgi:hypothetical protein